MTDWKEKYAIGSQWKTRDGHRAVVVEHEDDDFLVYHSLEEDLKIHNKDGLHFLKERDRDLIEPLKEPRKGVFWVNVYDDNNNFYGHKTKERADEAAGSTRLACKRVEWCEGDVE